MWLARKGGSGGRGTPPPEQPGLRIWGVEEGKREVDTSHSRTIQHAARDPKPLRLQSESFPVRLISNLGKRGQPAQAGTASAGISSFGFQPVYIYIYIHTHT